MPDRSRRSAAPLTSVRPVPRPDNLSAAHSNSAAQDALKGTEPAGSDSTLALAARHGEIDANVLEAVSMRVTAVANRHTKGMKTTELVPDNVRDVLEQCAADRIENAAQVAYILATALHESAFGATKYRRSEPLVEDRNTYSRAQNGSYTADNHVTGGKSKAPNGSLIEMQYWDDAYGHKLGNRHGTWDAANFKGRGFVQLTGRTNYEKMTNKLRAEGFTYTQDGVVWGQDQPIDLAANPTHVNENSDLAAKVMVMGTMDGDYTGRALPDYVNDEQTDFKNARSVINGDTAENGDKIAKLASAFQSALGGNPDWTAVFGRSAQ
ncbi:MAG: hypothetical protein EP330_17940 [Deltaproteobacteria bacterium]|nr:MAG: hypothetical protein EP330_17940 [Deltaproteobacteria bacterium]